MFNIFITKNNGHIKCFHASCFEIRDNVLTITLRSTEEFSNFPQIKRIRLSNIRHMCFEKVVIE